MWKHYFGPQAKIDGVDIEPGRKAYEDEQVKVFIGDQAGPAFWRVFKEKAFSHLRPGSIF